MGIHAGLVLGEEGWVQRFSYVVIERAGTHELRTRAYLVGHLGGKVGHLHGVDERALCHFRHAAHDGIVRVAQFHKRHAGGEAEEFFQKVEQGIGEEKNHAVDGKVEIDGAVEVCHVYSLRKVVAKGHKPTCKHHEQCHLEELRTLGKFVESADGCHAGHYFHHEKLIVAVERQRGERHGTYQRHERRAGVHEDAHEDGNHSIGHNVDVEELLVYHQVSDEREDGNKRGKKQQAVGRLQVLPAEELEVDYEAEQHAGHEEHLSHDDEACAVGRVVALVVFPLEGRENLELVGRNDFAAVYDALSALHEARSGRNG